MRDHLTRVSRLTVANWAAGCAADCAVVLQAALLTPVAALAIRLCQLERALRLVAAIPIPVATPVTTAATDKPATDLTKAPPPAAPPHARLARLAPLTTSVTTRLGATCLTRAVVLRTLLTKHGVPAVVVIGAVRDVGGIRAHAWVESDGRIVSADGARGFLPLCRVDGHGTTRVAVA